MSTAAGRLTLLGRLLRTQGPGWLASRAAYALRCRSGWLRRRLPPAAWDDLPIGRFLRDDFPGRPEDWLASRRAGAIPFLFDQAARANAPATLRSWDGPGATSAAEAEADAIARGELTYFGHHRFAVGDPPDWHANPWTGARAPAEPHWTRIGDFGHGDIKAIWEPSRFGLAFPLVRAYWRDGDPAHAETFWRLLESWRAANPPHRGPNWKCGQEASLRLLAWCFGLYGFLDAPATTPARIADLMQMAAVSGRRVEATLGYALSQRNNHGVSEGAGLWTIGLMFPELRAAARWREIGRRVLESQARDLIDADGAFSQHSVVYHRLMLHAYLWSIRLGEAHGRPLSDDLKTRVTRAGDWLYQLQDECSGRVPDYGPVDGSLILPLDNCGYRDFRPTTQAVAYLSTGRRRHEPGPWDEALFWLFGPKAARAPVEPTPRVDLRAESGGYYTFRTPLGFAFTRCGRFRHRPGHADLLHVDIWWRGRNVATDAGTYSYNAPTAWDGSLAGTDVHNTVTVAGQHQMERPGRFLWLPWARGRVRHRADSGGGRLTYWEGEHDGYARLDPPATHRRAIFRLGDEHWLVLDEVSGPGPSRCRLHWLLADGPHRWEPESGTLRLETDAGPYEVRVGGPGDGEVSLIRADSAGPRGWRAAYYMKLEPALSLALERDAAGGPARFWSLLGPPADLAVAADEIRVASPGWSARVTLGVPGRGPLATRAVLEGTGEDHLEVNACTSC